MRRLNTYVHVLNGVGERHVFGPGDPVPAWAEKKITNPDVWDDGDNAQDDARVDETNAVEVPPLTGTGSGRERWAQYAAAHGVQVPEDAKRDQIVEVLREAGVPVSTEQDQE